MFAVSTRRSTKKGKAKNRLSESMAFSVMIFGIMSKPNSMLMICFCYSTMSSLYIWFIVQWKGHWLLFNYNFQSNNYLLAGIYTLDHHSYFLLWSTFFCACQLLFCWEAKPLSLLFCSLVFYLCSPWH